MKLISVTLQEKKLCSFYLHYLTMFHLLLKARKKVCWLCYSRLVSLSRKTAPEIALFFWKLIIESVFNGCNCCFCNFPWWQFSSGVDCSRTRNSSNSALLNSPKPSHYHKKHSITWTFGVSNLFLGPLEVRVIWSMLYVWSVSLILLSLMLLFCFSVRNYQERFGR